MKRLRFLLAAFTPWRPASRRALRPWVPSPRPAARNLAPLLLALVLLLGCAAPAAAADLQVAEVSLGPCPREDPGSQSGMRRATGASCYALRGQVTNPGRNTVVDTDVFAVIVDASGEPVLPNRTRVGTIGDIQPGTFPFALRLAVPAGTPGPFTVRRVKARGFSAPVRTRAGAGEERLPLEQELAG